MLKKQKNTTKGVASLEKLHPNVTHNGICMMRLVFLLGVFAITHVGGYTISDSGDGNMHVLDVVADVWLERPFTHYHNRKYLLVGRGRQFPLKRSLLRFESLKSCPVDRIRWAKMYVYYLYAHKPSWHPPRTSPALTHTVNIHRVLKPWKESEATTIYRKRNVRWSTPYLNLGRDAEKHPQYPPTTIYTSQPSSFIEFDVTRAVVAWKSGDPNHGVLMKVMNEAENGRDLRFASNRHKDGKFHARIHVMCDY